jgi:UDP-N-acetylmuramyl pentapeptide phosphotransferase/UDP-N-acetylglucosamine-1-phosphate transferase
VTDLVPLLVGAGIAALLAPGALRTFAENGWTRANYRGRELPFPGGVVAIAAGLLAAGVLAGLDRVAGTELLLLGTGYFFGSPEGHDPTRPFGVGGPGLSAAWLCTGVALLGALDDLLDAPPRGWRGHASVVLRGRFSTGALKAAGTLALALAVLAGEDDYGLAVAVVVLATNVFNLLDLRPGRSAKVFVALGAGLLLATRDTELLRWLGAFLGPLLVLAVFDLRERTMLGDTGANVLGAMAGLWLVWALDTIGLIVALAVLLAITIYGELRSISAAIEKIGPLRAADRLGRPPDPPSAGLH